MSFTKLDDDLSRFGNIISSELAKALKDNIDSLYASVPIGEICPIMTNIPGVTVDPNIWQECNGSPITCPTSPLRGTAALPRYTPNLRNRYLKMPTSLGLVGAVGGSHTYAGFGHNHGGTTGPHEASRGIDWSAGDDATYNVKQFHSHGISMGATGNYNMEPRYFTLKFFMKIQ